MRFHAAGRGTRRVFRASVNGKRLTPGASEAGSGTRLGLAGGQVVAAVQKPDLDRIMEVALNENPGLRKAYARLGEADAVAQVEGARLLPWLDSDNTFRQLRYAKHGIV